MSRSAFIFVTCLVDQFFPEVGFSVANVLKRFDVDVKVNTSQTCCGQPFSTLDIGRKHGDWPVNLLMNTVV
ncbi:MAG: hypothetical protein CL781_01455 [Chloroflexi bacterium]|nr:hypothetical protein [Chloroflexota bacterium]